MRLLWRRKWIILLAGLACGGIAAATTRVLPLRYHGEGLLVAERTDTAPDPTSQMTDADILQSRALLASVVDDLHLADRADLVPTLRLPQAIRDAASYVRRQFAKAADSNDAALSSATEAAIDALRAHLLLERRETSRAMFVRYDAGSPLLAAAVPNAVMQRYVAGEVANKRQQAERSSQWLQEKAETARQALDTAEQRVQAFQQRRDVVTLQAGSVSALQLSAEQSQLASANQDLARAQSIYDTAQRSGATSAPEVFASPVVQSLRQRETSVLQRIAGAAQAGSRNPVRVALDDELRTVRQQISSESRKVVSSLARDVDIARRRAASAQAAVVRAQFDATGSKDALQNLNQMMRDADTKRARYQALLDRTQEAQYSAFQLASVRIVSLAVPPPRPEASRLPVMLLLGAVAGMLAAASWFMARHLFSPRIESAHGLIAFSGAPSVGSLPKLGWRDGARMPALVLEQGHSPVAETVRGIRLGLQDFAGTERNLSILVTSAERGEGKSSAAATLAQRSAGDGLRVLLIEADLHRPSLARLLQLKPEPSLESVIDGSYDFRDSIQNDPLSNLHCILARGGHPNPLALLASDRFAALLQYARANYDLVLIDSPPVLRVPDPVLLARFCDVVLLAVRSERTAQAQVIEALQRFPAKCHDRIATLLTHARPTDLNQPGFYGGYHDHPTRPTITSTKLTFDAREPPQKMDAETT